MDESRIFNASVINQAAPSRIPVRSISLLIVVAVILYVGMVSLADWEKFGVAVSLLPAELWVQVVLLSLLSYLLRFVRWNYFIAAFGYKVPILRNLGIYLAAFALTLTPGKMGEMIRTAYLHPYGVTYAHSICAFFSERLLDLLAVGVLASFMVSMLPEQQSWIFVVIVSVVAVFLFFLSLRSPLDALIGRRNATDTVFGHFSKMSDAMGFLLSGRRFAIAAPLSLVAWMVQGISLYLVVHALGYDLAVCTIIAIYCLSILAGAVSFIPGGIGATEAAIVLLLSMVGIGQADAITASLVSRGITLWLAVGIGAVAMIKTVVVHGNSTFVKPSG